ncbi:MAG: type II toxin-antitoxin system Phd/YefM family antitoxin [Candidatus Acidiferrum sp.]
MYTVHEAKTNLSKLLRKAENGEDVVIARGSKPVAKLIALTCKRKKRVPGSFKGKIHIHPSFFDPMTKEELAEWGIE